MNKKIVFLYDLRHPLHEKFMRTTGCDFIPFSKKPPKNYDIYIVEGTYIRPLLLKKIGKFEKNAKIITLFSDPRLFYLKIGKIFDFKKDEIKKYPQLRAFAAKKLLTELDGAICIGNFSESLFRNFNKKSPVLNAPAFVFEKRAEKFRKIIPDLNNHNILFIGHGPDYYCKGLDLLIEVFKNIKNKIPDLKLYILGKWNIKEEWKIKDVFFEGVQDLKPYLKKCSLSVHLGRGESFGINILESMTAGIPTFVSEYTGAKQAVMKADNKLILPMNKKIISEKLMNYLYSDLKEKKSLSKKCRKAAEQFNEKDTLEIFREKFSGFIEKVGKK
ncbi:MAG: glycosyltransferase [Candidatus Pacearchaeota archaeon]|nr:glycosyltransferase [Candidatus Pacearchaeota archaeon]